MDTRQDRVMVEPEEGESLSLGGLRVVFKISAEETGGAFSIVEHPIEPGRLVPPHVHHAEDEVSFVTEGRIGARIGDREVLAGSPRRSGGRRRPRRDELLHNDIVFRYPGSNPLTGDYRGKNEVLGLMGRVMESTGGALQARGA